MFPSHPVDALTAAIRWLALAGVLVLVVVGRLDAEDAKPRTPATYEEFSAVLDLAKLPKLPGAQKDTRGDSYLNYSASGEMAAAADFYRKTFQQRGWKELEEAIPGIDRTRYDYFTLEKNGFAAVVAIVKGEKEGTLTVSIQSLGNVDPRALPRPEGAKVLNHYRNIVRFTTDSSPENVEAFCKQQMNALGWKEEIDDTAAFHRKEGRIILNFVRNAMKVLIVISKNAQGTTEATYMPQLRDNAALFAKKNAGAMARPATREEAVAAIDFRKLPRFKDAKAPRTNSAALYYEVEGDFAEAVSFVRSQLEHLGWKEVQPRGLETDTQLSTHFEKNGFQIQISVNKNSRNGKIEIGGRNEGNVDLRKLPRLDDARVTLAEHALLHYTTARSVDEAAEFCQTELKRLGWHEADSKRNDQGRVLYFFQGGMRLSIEIGKGQEGRTSVHVTPWVMGVS